METDLNKLRDLTYDCAKKNGIHNYSNKHLLMLVITKICAVVGSYMNKKHADINKFCFYTPSVVNSNMNIYIKEYENYIKDSVEDNLADVVIRLLDFTGVSKIDISFKEGKMKMLFDYYMNMPFTDLALLLCGFLSMGSETPLGARYYINFSLQCILKWCECRTIEIFQYIDLRMMYNERRNIYKS